MERMIDRAAWLYRQARYYAYWAFEPLDALVRRVNHLEQYPPVRLRRHVSLLGTLDGQGFEYVSYLKLLTQLQPDAYLWDISCGCGLLELALETAQWPGRVLGTDIHKPSIQWAQRTITRRMPRYRFEHANIYNAAYWTAGTLSAAEWFKGFDGADFDVAIAKSLFTHMLPEELDLYLGQVAARLKPGGQALLTFFVLNERQAELRARNAFAFTRPTPGAVHAVRRLNAPTAAVAYDEAYVWSQLHRHGLADGATFHFGTWSGRPDGLSFQDMLIVRK